MKTEVVITADDLGLTAASTTGILCALEEGLVSRASIILTTEHSLSGVRTVKERHLAERVGLHVSLSEGVPLTTSIRAYGRFCSPSGEFAFSRSRRTLWLAPKEGSAIRDEVLAQLEACRAGGIDTAWVDSHHAIHEEPGILRILLPLLVREGVRGLRLCQTGYHRASLLKRLYRRWANGMIRRYRLAESDHFGSVADYVNWQDARPGGRWEIAVHPTLAPDGLLIDAIERVPLRAMVARIVSAGEPLLTVRSSGLRLPPLPPECGRR